MYEKEVYEFSSTPNKAGVMLPFETFEVFAADDYGFGYVASLTGKMGLGSAHLLSSADREFVYQFDKEGYPVKVEVRDEESPEDNFTCTMRFDWPN